jgi:CDP-diacylglycerol--glycerol-3-phosphate 3-phosphatidyltransferase
MREGRAPSSRALAWAPNALTLLRVALAPAILGALLWAAASPAPALLSGRTSAAGALLLLAAALDWLDGRLARALAAESAFGVFWDPVADKLVIGAALVGAAIAAPSIWIFVPAFALLARDGVVTWMRTRPRFAAATSTPSRLAKWKTAAEYASLVLLFAAGSLVRAPVAAPSAPTTVPWTEHPLPAGVIALAIALLWAAAAMSVWTGTAYVRIARRTAR